MALAQRFNEHIEGFKGVFGEIGDNRLTVMAGIAVVDELVEAERRIKALKDEVETMQARRDAAISEADEIKAGFARMLNDVSRKIEAVATAIDETGLGHPAQ